MNDNTQTVTPTSPTPTAPMPEMPIGPTEPVVTPPHKSGGMKSMMMWLLAIIFALALGAGGYVYGKNKAPAKEVTKTVTAPTPELKLPQGATLLSKCTKGYGAQYALPKDLPNGPYYNVYQGKVIGFEYMIDRDDLTVAMNKFLNHPVDQAKYNHIDVTYAEKGHAGFPTPHFHVTLFTVPATETEKITCATTWLVAANS